MISDLMITKDVFSEATSENYFKLRSPHGTPERDGRGFKGDLLCKTHFLIIVRCVSVFFPIFFFSSCSVIKPANESSPYYDIILQDDALLWLVAQLIYSEISLIL